MSTTTLKTTLKVESPALFPSQRGYTPFTTSHEVSTSGEYYQDLLINDEEPTYLSPVVGGAEGSFIYIKAADSNPSHTVVNIYDRENAKPFMTLKAGEFAFVPVPHSQEGLYALTTFGEAQLNYFYADRGRKAGESVIIYQVDSVAESSNWFYCVLDTAIGGTPDWIDTGYNRNDWSMYVDSIVNDKGYVLRYYNNEFGYNNFQFVNSRGEVIPSNIPTGNFAYNSYSNNGKAFVIFYEVGEGTQAMAYFDGDNLYYHEFDYTTSIYLDSNYDSSTKDGTVTVYAENYDDVGGREVVFLINRDQKVMISDIIFNDNAYYVDTFVNYYADFVVLQTWDDDNWRLVNLKIFATNGELLKTVNFTAEDDINDTDYYFYGVGNLQIVYENDNNSVYTLLNYNEKTGVLLGFDKDWKHESGEDYDIYSIIASSLDLEDNRDGNRNSVAITFGSSEYEGGILSNRPYAFDITCLFEGQTTPKNYVIHSGGLGDFYYSSDYILTNDSFSFLYGSSHHDSIITAYVISKDLDEPKNIKLIDDKLFNYDYNGWWNFDRFGDYSMMQLNSEEYDTTTYVVWDKDGVLDTLVIPNSNEGNYRTRKNSLFIREWYDAESCWYFDIKTNKFVLIPEFYSQRGWTQYGTEIDATNNGKMVLVKPEYYGNNNNVEARILDNGILSEKVVLLDASVMEWSNMFWEISDETFIIGCRPNNTYVIKVYDLNLNYLYTVETGLDGWNEAFISANRRSVTYFEDYSGSNNGAFYSFGKLLSKAEIPNDENWEWRANDYDWWNNW